MGVFNFLKRSEREPKAAPAIDRHSLYHQRDINGISFNQLSQGHPNHKTLSGCEIPKPSFSLSGNG